MTDSKRISGADILAMRSQAAEAENYAIIARANIDRLTRAYAALEIEVVHLRARLAEKPSLIQEGPNGECLYCRTVRDEPCSRMCSRIEAARWCERGAMEDMQP